ncbi:hypothetical protein MNB_SM-4-667 [hydrothermal vent metagenome]|uniref:Uncharacterized protein n=1 Tax=hydrothermal vent metagenome TaxID=652676 RepID=A0A1W1CFM3_9ZZZZ
MLSNVLKYVFFISFLVIGILGCNEDSSDEDEVPAVSISSFSEIKVASSFTWETSSTLTLELTAFLNAQESGLVFINLSFIDYEDNFNMVPIYKGSIENNNTAVINLKVTSNIQDFNLRATYKNKNYDQNLSREDLKNLQIIDLRDTDSGTGDVL